MVKIYLTCLGGIESIKTTKKHSSYRGKNIRLDFINRGLPVPEPAPYIELTVLTQVEFNERDDQNYVKGDAAEFCHVVTQGRNIEDVELEVLGGPATEWMKIAQCFAGPPEDPPLPGSRTKNFSK